MCIKEDNKSDLISPLSMQAGEFLLHGLSRLADYQFQNHVTSEEPYLFRDRLFSAHTFLKTAINAGVVHASLLTRKIIQQSEDNEDFEEFLLDLTMRSAARGDYRALEKFLLWALNHAQVADQEGYNKHLEVYNKRLRSLLKSWEEDEHHYPPMRIFSIGCMIQNEEIQESEDFQKVLEEAEFLFKQTIENYPKDQDPIFLSKAWLIGVEINQRLGKWIEADACMHEVMLILGENMPYPNWMLRAEIKEKLGDVENAIIFLKEIDKRCMPCMSENEEIDFGIQKGDKVYNLGNNRIQVIKKEQVEILELKLNELQGRYEWYAPH